MSLIDFFVPVEIQKLTPSDGFLTSQLGSHIRIYSDISPNHGDGDFDLALFGILDDRRAVDNQGCALAPDYIRERLYALHKGDYNVNIVDLGNIKAGATVNDTYSAVKTVVSELLKRNIVPVILGGGQDITYAQYLAYETLEQRVDLVVIDSQFDLDNMLDEQLENTSRTFLSKILFHQPNYLFNYSNVGYQTFYVSQESLRVMEKLFFDTYRLGLYGQDKIEHVEPIIRNADILSFDVGAIRSSDAMANANASPNGFYGEQACQICRYAGMSDKLSSIGFYEMNPVFDHNGQTAILLAQMIWYFVDGYYNRRKDFPMRPKSAYITYRTAISEHEHELVFVKSKKTDRWWMQVPYPNTKSANERFHMVPCSYKDYQTAVDGEMPDLWWRTYQKLV